MVYDILTCARRVARRQVKPSVTGQSSSLILIPFDLNWSNFFNKKLQLQNDGEWFISSF